MLRGLFGGPKGGRKEDYDSEVETLLQRVSESRHAAERRDAMGQLRDLLQDSPQAQQAMGTMGLPVLLSVVQEDRDDLELTRTALEALALSFAHGGGPGMSPGGTAAGAGQQRDALPPPGAMNAELFARSPDNVRLLLSLLEDEPVGCEDFYCRYHALQALGALLAAAPERVQAAVLSAPLGVIRLMDLLGSGMEVLRNEALLLLVGLCSGCEEVSKIAAFEGAFERLLALVREEGGPSGGGVLVQDALELTNNLLRDSPANQRLFREMGHAAALPPLLAYEPPGAGAAGAAAGLVEAAAAATAGSAAGALAANAAAAASGVAAAAAAVAASSMAPQVAANFLVLLETARLLLVAPAPADDPAARAQQAAQHTACQDALAAAGLTGALVALCLDEGGAPSAVVRAQALLCLGDLIARNNKLQAELGRAGVRARPRGEAAAGAPTSPTAQRIGGSFLPPPPPPAGLWGVGGPAKVQWQQLPLLQAALRAALWSPSHHETVAGTHLIGAFCEGNVEGQVSLAATLTLPPGGAAAGAGPGPPESFGRELWESLTATGQPPSRLGPLAGVQRAALVLRHIVDGSPQAKERLGAALGGGDAAMGILVKLLADTSRRSDAAARSAACALLRLLVVWCVEAPAAVTQLISAPGHLPLLVDLAGGRLGGGSDSPHLPGLAALLLGTALLYAPDGTWARQHQPQAAAQHGGGGVSSVVLDVVLHRLGLSQFMGRLDDLAAARSFAAALSGPRMPGHITRAAAAAVLEREAAGASEGTQPDGSDEGGGPYDRPFAEAATHITAAVRALTLQAFAGAPAGAPQPPPLVPNGNAAPPLPPGVPPVPMPSVPHTAPHGPPHAAAPGAHPSLLPPVPTFPGAPAGGAMPPRPFMPTLPGMQQQQQPAAFPGQQQQQQQVAVAPPPVPAPAAAGVGDAVGASAAIQQQQQQLAAALTAVARLQAEVEDLRGRNRALAEDLVRAGGGGSSGAAGGAADAEARAALQLRASRAEMETGTLRQHLATMQQQWRTLEAAVTEAQRDKQEALAAVARAEADLSSLGAAYNALEEHSQRMEGELAASRTRAEAAETAGAAGKGAISPEEVEVRIAAAVATALQQEREQQRQREQQQPAGGADLDARIAVAVEEARAAATAESDDAMGDLLVCLGQEEAKVAALSERLAALGEDVDALLAAAGVGGDEEEEEQ